MDRREEILAVAEREIRKGGLGAISFRDIAQEIGIKSASVHYHFPTKADLSEAVVVRYAKRFEKGLGDPSRADETPTDRLTRFCDAYLAAYREDGSTCLCAVLGATSVHLPEGTPAKVREFFSQLKTWLDTALADAKSRLPADMIISLLQGAMILSIATENRQPILDAKTHILHSLDPRPAG